MFTTTRANRVCKSFSFSLSVCQLNCLRTSKGLSLGSWYVSVVSTFPNTFALVLDSNLYDLNGTNRRTDAVFNRIATMLFYVQKTNILGMTWNSTEHLRKNNKKSSPKMKTRGPTPCPRGWEARPSPLGVPPTSWAPWWPSDANSNSIYWLSRRKNQRESFIAFYDTEPPPSPNLSLEGWYGVCSGLWREGFVAVVIINHPPSPISWCSPPCVSNSIVGLLDGGGLDEIYHVIELVLLGFDP